MAKYALKSMSALELIYFWPGSSSEENDRFSFPCSPPERTAAAKIRLYFTDSDEAYQSWEFFNTFCEEGGKKPILTDRTRFCFADDKQRFKNYYAWDLIVPRSEPSADKSIVETLEILAGCFSGLPNYINLSMRLQVGVWTNFYLLPAHAIKDLEDHHQVIDRSAKESKAIMHILRQFAPGLSRVFKDQNTVINQLWHFVCDSYQDALTVQQQTLKLHLSSVIRHASPLVEHSEGYICVVEVPNRFNLYDMLDYFKGPAETVPQSSFSVSASSYGLFARKGAPVDDMNEPNALANNHDLSLLKMSETSARPELEIEDTPKPPAM